MHDTSTTRTMLNDALILHGEASKVSVCVLLAVVTFVTGPLNVEISNEMYCTLFLCKYAFWNYTFDDS